MRYLITGGAGFIGSHLAERLLALGETVSVIDDLSTGSMDNIAHLRGTPRFQNVRGTELVLDLANKKKKRVLIASTSEVYGKSNRVPFNEEDDLLLGAPTKGRWSYACSKAIDEFLAIAYWREKKLPVTIVRLFNTVGPRQTGRYGMVIPSLVKQALMGQPLTVFGDGEQSRCFGHVRDVVEALVALIQTPGSTGEIFNVGSDREITINSLAELVREMTESSAPIVHMSYDDAYADGFEEIRRRVRDLTKIRRLIGYAPRYDIRDILRDVIEHMRNGTGGLRS